MRSPAARGWLLVPALVLACWSGAAGAACTISAAGVAFGIYIPTNGTPLDANGSVTVTCNLDAGFFQTFNYTTTFSTGSSLSFATRRMVRSGGTQTTNYNIFNAGYAQVLGNGTGGTATYAGSIFVWIFDNSNAVTHPVAGRMPALQNAVPGSYLDTIVATVTF